MFANVLRLELRKQRQDFLIVVGFAAAVLICFFAEAVFRNRNLAEIFQDVIGYVSIAFVFVLALTGANAGIHLRHEPYKSAEEPLPFSPAHKVLSAYLVNVLYLSVGASFFLITGYSFGLLGELNWMQPALFLLLMIHFHMLCFILAYWLNQAILATVLAALVVWCEFFLIEQRTFFYYLIVNPYVSTAEASLTTGSVVCLIVSFIGGLISLVLISRRIERQQNVRWIPGFIASFILILGSLLLFVQLIRTSHVAQTTLRNIPYLNWVNEYLDTSSASTSTTGAFLTTNTGSIVRVTSEGRTVLRKVPLHLISKPKQFDVVAVYEDIPQNEFWTIIRNDEAASKDYGIWRAPAGGKLQLYLEFDSKGVTPSYLRKRGNHFFVYGYTQQNIAYATIFEKGLGEWQFVQYQSSDTGYLGSIRKLLFQEEIDNGNAAVLSRDKTYVMRHLSDGTIQKWSLPGKGDLPPIRASIITATFRKDGQPYFVIPVYNENKTSLFVCKPDGSVAQLWDKSWSNNERLTGETVPNGGYAWVVRDAKSWRPVEAFVLTEIGETFPPFPIKNTSGYGHFVDFVKKDNSSLWVLTDQNLEEVDFHSGKSKKQFDISADGPDSNENVFRTRTKEGVYYVKNDRICLIDWNGKVKDLGPASLN